jgi:hypothetical protein
MALLAGVIALSAIPRAHGQVVAGEWETVASACVPDEESAGKYAMEFASFQFLGSSTGSVDGRCNVTNPRDDTYDPHWGLMEVTYSDPDGASAGSQVVVYLRRVNKTTGSSSDIAVFNSNLFAAGQQLRTVSFTHTFNFADYGYYVALSVRRNSSSLAPKLQRVRLRLTPIP